MGKCVTNLIVGLGKGGAETMLYQIMKYKTNPSIEYRVISLGASHFYEQPIRDLGIPVVETSIQKRPLSAVFRIYRELKETDTLCCWMDHASFLGAVIGKIAGVNRIIWNIRHSSLDPKLNKRTSLFITELCAKMSAGIDVIAYNGIKARTVYESVGFCNKKGVVLDNGVDSEEFCPDDKASKELRAELGIAEDKRIILSVARYDPIKDIPTFLEAFALMHQKMPETVAVMCGMGITVDNQQIARLCQKKQLIPGKDIYLLGMRNDIPRIMAGSDLFVLHSAGEAFPNTLIQAMSCGCVCVATDVGDVRQILNDDKWIAHSRNPGALCAKMEQAIQLKVNDSTSISKKNRIRAVNEYGIEKVVSEYEKILT